MRQRIILNCQAEPLFDQLTAAVIESYKKEKGEKPTEKQLMNKLHFETIVKKGQAYKKAKIIVKKYKRPTSYTMEYKSDTYHKIEEIQIKPLGDQCELIYGKQEEKIKDGKVTAKNGDLSDPTIKDMSFFAARDFKKIAKYLNSKKTESK